jgi:hypothetical protein
MLWLRGHVTLYSGGFSFVYSALPAGVWVFVVGWAERHFLEYHVLAFATTYWIPLVGQDLQWLIEHLQTYKLPGERFLLLSRITTLQQISFFIN